MYDSFEWKTITTSQAKASQAKLGNQKWLSHSVYFLILKYLQWNCGMERSSALLGWWRQTVQGSFITVSSVLLEGAWGARTLLRRKSRAEQGEVRKKKKKKKKNGVGGYGPKRQYSFDEGRKLRAPTGTPPAAAAAAAVGRAVPRVVYTVLRRTV